MSQNLKLVMRSIIPENCFNRIEKHEFLGDGKRYGGMK
jgi:hypothetical protein